MRFDRDQKPAKLYLLFLAGILLVVMLYTVGGFWILPVVVKSLLEKHLSQALHRPVAIEKVCINPYELSFSIRGLAVQELNSTDNFLAFDELYAVVQGGSLVERAPILREVKLSGPYVNLSRREDGRFNFSDLLEAPNPEQDSLRETASKPAAGPDSGAATGRPQVLKFSIRNIQILNGTVDYQDEAKGEKERIANLHLELPLISSLGETPDGSVKLSVEAKINQSPLSVNARGILFPAHPEWVVDIQVKDFNLLDYLAYLPPQLQLKVHSGLIDAKAGLTYAETEAEPILKITGEANLSDFEAVDRKDTHLITLPRVNVVLASFEPLAHKLHLSSILIQSPQLDLWRNADGTLNLQTLITPGGTETEEDNGSKREPGLEVKLDSLELAEGKLRFTDHAAEAKFQTELEGIALSIRDFSTTPGSRAGLKLDARTGDNETLGVEGAFTLSPFHGEGRMGISGVRLAKYAPYYQKHILFDILDGRLDVASTAHVDLTAKDLGLKVSDLSSTLTALKLKKPDEGGSFLQLPSLQLKGGTLDLGAKRLAIDEVMVENGMLATVRNNKGEFNLQQLFPASPPTMNEKAALSPGSHAEQPPWKVLLQKVEVNGYAVRFEDQMMMPESVVFLVDQIHLEARDFSTTEESKPHISLSCRVNEGGTVQVEGELKTTPLFADLKLNLKDLEILPVQPYLPGDIKVKLKGGKLSSSGKLLLAAPKDGDFNASYLGDIALWDFSSVDTLAGDDFLRWKRLEIKGLDAGNNPARASIKRIDWGDYFARIAISADAKINILQILGSDTEVKTAGAAGEPERTPKAAGKNIGKGEAAPAKEAEIHPRKPQALPPERRTEQPPVITIDQIAMQGGTIAFSDNHIKPNVHAQMLEVGGTISGLSSRKDVLADVNLRGKLYRTSPLEITGKLRPFPDNLFADLTVSFKNIDMTRWDPYARKYVGYTLEKGNLHLELKYLLAKKKLDSQNNIVLDRLTLGEKVDSPDATTLPVKFAISLLQDRNGQIELGIPVSGDLDDPQFRLGSIILTFLKNLIMKAITAPFALLGTLLPQGVGEIDRIEMIDAGGKIPEAGVKKIEALVKVLQDRPNLELDIQGYVQGESGKELLRQQLFQNKLRAQKLQEVMKQGGASVPLDQVTIAPEESEKYLKMAYDQEFPKEGLDRIRFFKKTPSAEMKTRLLSTIHVTDDDLRSLAYEWALSVKEYLQETGKIEPRRLFLLEPVLVGPADQAKANGVDFKLK